MGPSFWTLDRVADALNGSVSGGFPRGVTEVRAISTDTRTVGAGDLFVALKGERFDAHEFLAEAVKKGARAVVVEHPAGIGSLNVPQFQVPDTLGALGALANYRRRAWSRGSGKPVVGVAGSNGKTTTKDLIAAALGRVLNVHATTGNLNNLVGVPLTLLALPDTADIAVVEMGVNVPGEMARLRAILEPDISVVTSVGEEHLEGLGSLEGVLREEALSFTGASVAVTPASQPDIARAARGVARRVVSAGLDDGDVRAARWGIGADGLGWIEVDGTTVRPPVRGAHNLRNTMLALAVARECGVSAAAAAAGIAEMRVPAMRLAWETLGHATLINDAYNANPASMRSALELLTATGSGRQRVAILGTMREMGPHAQRLHDELAREALSSPIEIIAAVGQMADALEAAGNLDNRVVSAADVDELWSRLEPRLERTAIILLKASRGVRLERMLPHLTAWANNRMEP